MCQIGPCPTLWVEFDYRAPTDEAASSDFGSSLRPYWRESEVQLTKNQAVLSIHDIYKWNIITCEHSPHASGLYSIVIY